MAEASFVCGGFLKKKRHKFNKWNRRWFVLRGNKLLWFAEKDDAEEVGSTKITPGSTVVNFPPETGECDYQFSFSTPTFSRLYKAKTQQELDMWVDNLRKVIKAENAKNPAAAIISHKSKNVLQKLFKRRKSHLHVKTKEHRVFGIDLERGDIMGTPAYLQDWYNYLKRYGLKVAGVFRKPGENNLVKRLKEMYENNEQFDFVTEVGGTQDAAIHCGASLLKLFFRELEVPLFLEECNDVIIEAAKHEDDANVIYLLGNALAELSKSRQMIIKDLFLFLHKVATNSEYNLMTPDNLAVCLTPSLFQTNSFRTLDDLKDLKPLTAMTAKYIQFANKISFAGRRVSQMVANVPKLPCADHHEPAEAADKASSNKSSGGELSAQELQEMKTQKMLAAAGWESKKTADGRVFYFHRAEQRSSWSADGIVHCWIEVESKGKRYYYHSHTHERRWDKPDDF